LILTFYEIGMMSQLRNDTCTTPNLGLLGHVAVELSTLNDLLILTAKNGKTYEEIQHFLSDRSLFTKSLNEHKEYLHQVDVLRSLK